MLRIGAALIGTLVIAGCVATETVAISPAFPDPNVVERAKVAVGRSVGVRRFGPTSVYTNARGNDIVCGVVDYLGSPSGAFEPYYVLLDDGTVLERSVGNDSEADWRCENAERGSAIMAVQT